MNNECCGTCKFHTSYKLCGKKDWLCNNPEAEEYGIETEYGHWCEEYEGQE